MGSLVSAIFGLVLIFCTVLCLALFGIITRPLDFLAAFWPVNAVLLGLLLRKPRLVSGLGWATAFVAYVLADILMAGELWITIRLTLANLAGVATAIFVVRKFAVDISDLHKPLSVLHLFGVCVVASLMSAIVGIGTVPSLFQQGLLPSIGLWFTTELLNFIIIVPLILTFPSVRKFKKNQQKQAVFSLLWSDNNIWYPLLALVFSVLMGVVIGGPGAILFSVPALLWCALAYSMFVTSLLTMLVCSFILIAISSSWMAVPFSDDYFSSITSVRLGVLLLALAPLTVASINADRIKLLRSLSKAANYDGLTSVLSRSAFMKKATLLITKLLQSQGPFSVIMIDIDHFKAVNDTYGHAVGDSVLVQVAAELSQVLREGDLLGRLGGEEFAVILGNIKKEDAQSLANRLCKTIESSVFIEEASGQVMNITISVGVVAYDEQGSRDLSVLLSKADKALYKAKNAGRNQVVYS